MGEVSEGRRAQSLCLQVVILLMLLMLMMRRRKRRKRRMIEVCNSLQLHTSLCGKGVGQRTA